MSTSTTTTRNTAQVSGVWLKPVECADEASVFEAAFDGIRRRPTMARKQDGTLVVCSSRTARKHGWKIEGRLFGDAPKPKKTAAPKAEKPVAPKKAPAKRAERLASLEEMLGTN